MQLHVRPAGYVAAGPTRIGFSVSKRVGDAVTRNLVKRRLREAVRHRLAALYGGWDLVVTARPSAAGVRYPVLAAELDDLFTRAGMWIAHKFAGIINMKYLGMGLIWMYQRTFSVILPSSCRFTPSCSQYGYTAIERFGLLRGRLDGYQAYWTLPPIL